MKKETPIKRDIRILVEAFLRLFLWGVGIGFLIFLIFLGPFHSFLAELSTLALVFIGVLAGVFALFGSIWILFLGHQTGWNRKLSAIAVMVFAVVASSPFAGLLWALFDIQSWQKVPYYDIPDSSALLVEGLMTGLFVVPITTLVGFPFNVGGLMVGYFLLDKVAKDLVGVPPESSVKPEMRENPYQPTDSRFTGN